MGCGGGWVVEMPAVVYRCKGTTITPKLGRIGTKIPFLPVTSGKKVVSVVFTQPTVILHR